MIQLFNYLQLDFESQKQIFITYMNLFQNKQNVDYFERQEFYSFIRLVSDFHSQHNHNHQVTKDHLVYKFDTSPSFIKLLSDWFGNMIGIEKEKNIALPPPPAKAKLKRVHTISGTAVTSTVSTSGDLASNSGRLFPTNPTNNNNSLIGGSGALQVSSSSTSSLSATNQPAASPPHPSTVAVPYPNSLNNNVLPTFASATTASAAVAQDPNHHPSTKYSQVTKVTSLVKHLDEAVVDNSEDDVLEIWSISQDQKDYYKKQFLSLQSDLLGSIRGNVAKIFFEKSGLPVIELSRIWKLSDIDHDGALSLPEFCIAMHLVVLRRLNVDIPNVIPDTLLSIYSSLSAVDGHHFVQPSFSASSSSNLFDSTKSLATFDDSLTDVIDEQFKEPSAAGGGGGGGGAIARQASAITATKNWTQFNDSPVPALGESSRTSPEQLVNFDYNVEYISKNPHIKHPVPVRLSPMSPSNLAFECVQKESTPDHLSSLTTIPTENAGSVEAVLSTSSSSFTSSSQATSQQQQQQQLATKAGDNWSQSQTKVSVSHFTSPILKSTRSNSNSHNSENSTTIPNGNHESWNDLEERIISRFKLPKEVSLPKNVTSIDDLHCAIRNLQEYSSTVTKINQEMLKEIVALTKLVRQLKN